jgi:hypothetical protein
LYGGRTANAVDTASVGSENFTRRIVSVTAGTGPNNAITFAQLQAARREL